MAEEIIFSVQESPEGGYEAKALPAPIFTEAGSGRVFCCRSTSTTAELRAPCGRPDLCTLEARGDRAPLATPCNIADDCGSGRSPLRSTEFWVSCTEHHVNTRSEQECVHRSVGQADPRRAPEARVRWARWCRARSSPCGGRLS